MRASAVGALATALALVSTACLPAPSSPPPPPPPPPIQLVYGDHLAAQLTPDGGDTYVITPVEGGFKATAPTTNKSANSRYAVLRADAATSVDQQACVTWDGPMANAIQPGLTLRVHSTAQSNRAIMITNNIYYSWRTGFNVHLAVSVADPILKQVGGVALPEAVGSDPFDMAPLPWRMCARAIGDQVELKVWQSAVLSEEPAWGDPDHTGVVTLPPDWVYAGRPGAYVGHLQPGESTSFSDTVTKDLPGGPGDAFWLAAQGWAGRLSSALYRRPVTPGERISFAAAATRGEAAVAAADAAATSEGRQASGRAIRTDLFGPTGADGLSATQLTVSPKAADTYAANALSAASANVGFTDAGFAEELYRRVLHRPATPTEVASTTAGLAGGQTRRTVALALYRSVENRDRLSSDAVVAALGRPATSAEVVAYALRLPALGYDPIRLRAEIAASAAPTWTGPTPPPPPPTTTTTTVPPTTAPPMTIPPTTAPATTAPPTTVPPTTAPPTTTEPATTVPPTTAPVPV